MSVVGHLVLIGKNALKYEQSESEDELNDSFESDHEFDSDYENDSSSTEEEEDNLNASRVRKRMRLLTDSERNYLSWQTTSSSRQLRRLFAFKRKGVKTPFGRNRYNTNRGRNSVKCTYGKLIFNKINIFHEIA
ncbi:hypothetical protein AVEN_121112-1 [Araneus ventricosus]|uniref:Uncharacterized protein n=1 Tax=Araneus ventricosus TaxID=182803 RepID=A0A4Y2KWF1_ARAVE|nr:hypothetical protein AVEN_121112-1 [Araneus ventricosus]